MHPSAMLTDIRSLYFPRWDRKKLWRSTLGSYEDCRGATGYCDSKARTIWFSKHQWQNIPLIGRRALMIHEICHVVAAAGHNRVWAARMDKAALLAISIGEEDVAEILKSDVFSYCGLGVRVELNSTNVYVYLDEVVDQSPDTNETGLAKMAGRHFGVAPSIIVRHYGLVLREYASRLET